MEIDASPDLAVDNNDPSILCTLPSRQLYRTRPKEELELAIARVEGGTEVNNIRLRSVESSTLATIDFKNESGERVRAIWLDFAGNEVAYSIIEPGETKRYRTYVTHPWILREVNTGHRMTINDSSGIFGTPNPTVGIIAKPPILKWTEKSHMLFPEDTRIQTRCILLCHSRLQKSNVTTASDFGEIGCCSTMNLFSRVQGFVGKRVSRRGSEAFDEAGYPHYAADEQDSRNLGDLPIDLVMNIIRFIIPTIQQCVEQAGKARAPDVKPILLPDNAEFSKFQPEAVLGDNVGVEQ